MFTGIIKEVGKVKQIKKKTDLWRVAVSSIALYKEASISDSIAVNGVCLTLIEKKDNVLSFEIIKPTLAATNLKRIIVNERLNLEASLKVGEQLGGHFVLGHVDCESQIKSIKRNRDFFVFRIKLPRTFRNLIVEKGSITVNGVSLTVGGVTSNDFTVHIIPYTCTQTNLGERRVNSWVNLEFDYLLKRPPQKQYPGG